MKNRFHDTEDGSLENTVRSRIVRMEFRFKQFQGRVLMNRYISIEARLNVFKTIVMTNGVYACETWNYTTNDIARIERHYFRLLRDVLLMPRSASPATNYISVMDYAAQQGIDEIFPMECLIQRQQLKFLWKIVHLEDTAIQKIVLFGKISSQFNGRRGGRKQTYVSCLRLALANFGVTMKECMEMTELDWQFHINNQALLEATAKWRARPGAVKPIDNFWAPGMQTRGKRKRILADDDQENSRTEDTLPSSVANQVILEMNNRADDGIAAGRADGDAPSKENDYKGSKRRRKSKPAQRETTEQSTQVFSMSENTVTDDENLEGHRDLERKANQLANQYAADALLARMEKISYADGTAQNSGMGIIGHSMDSANIDDTTAKSNSKKEKNHTKKIRQRTANKIKRTANLSNLSKSSAANILEPLRLIMGRENGFSQSHDQNIAWAHRTILGPTSHSFVQ